MGVENVTNRQIEAAAQDLVPELRARTASRM
jgi:hypothetical protein